jgi:hypothetical protein
MAVTQHCCFMGKGKFYSREFAKKSFPARFWGNVSQLDLKIDQDKIEQPDFTTSGGGVACSVTRIKSVNFELTANCMSPENIATGMFSTIREINAATATTDEEHVAHKGALVILNNPIPGTVTVNDKTTPATVYTAGTDYIVTGAGLYIPDTSTIPAPTLTAGVFASNIVVDYTPGNASIIELLTGSAPQLFGLLDGENEAEGASKVITKLYHMSFGPADGFKLLGDSLNTMKLTGQLLPDDSIVGAGLSRYGQFALANLA